jgi:hypothetical protein
MRKHEFYPDYHDCFEYLGYTEIERTRQQGSRTIRQDWIIFDSKRAARQYFNDRCGAVMGYYP